MTPLCPTLVGYGDRLVCRRPYSPYLESLRLWTVRVEQGTALTSGSPLSSPCTLQLTAIASKGQLLGVWLPNSEPQPVRSLPAALWTGVEHLPPPGTFQSDVHTSADSHCLETGWRRILNLPRPPACKEAPGIHIRARWSLKPPPRI